MTARLRVVSGLLILAATVPFASWWEAGLVRHVLGHVPLLVAAGALLAPRGGRPVGQPTAIAAVLVAAFCIAFWMIPRWLDAAVNSPAVDAAKMASLVLLAGVPVGWAWPRLAPLARGFVLAQLASMFGILGAVWLAAPVRLCNNYLVDEQTVLGRIALAVAVAMVVAGLVAALAGPGITRARPAA
ncbi:MAG: hypothetical protein H3C51_02425 [Rubellimicrobium sp.]|nr:hypothetical protein [Rubellimicrobium sp.]